jgi:hypothetical protein
MGILLEFIQSLKSNKEILTLLGHNNSLYCTFQLTVHKHLFISIYSYAEIIKSTKNGSNHSQVEVLGYRRTDA